MPFSRLMSVFSWNQMILHVLCHRQAQHREAQCVCVMGEVREGGKRKENKTEQKIPLEESKDIT